MLCGISKEVPREPVVTKEGVLYERSLIESYLQQHGTCPTTGTALTTGDLTPVRSGASGAGVAGAPRTPAVASIPGLLSHLQSEWEATVLEAFSLRKQLTQAHQELSQTLYHHDASLRVIARLVKERDAALARLETIGATSNPVEGSGMDVEEVEEEEDCKALESSLKKKLKAASKAASKAGIISPTGAVGTEAIAGFGEISHAALHKTVPAGVVAVDVDPTNISITMSGGKDGAVVFNNSNGGEGGCTVADAHQGVVNSVSFLPKAGNLAVSGGEDGSVKVWMKDGDSWSSAVPAASFQLNSAVVEVVPQPVDGGLVAVAETDGAWSLLDIDNQTVLTKAKAITPAGAKGLTCTSFAYHPHGKLVAMAVSTGKDSGAVEVWNSHSVQHMMSFEVPSSPTAVSFSPDSFHLAVATADKNVQVWDIRDTDKPVATFATSGSVHDLKFSVTGGALGVAVGSSVEVVNSASWETMATLAGSHKKKVTSISWGPSSLASAGMDRRVVQWGVAQ